MLRNAKTDSLQRERHTSLQKSTICQVTFIFVLEHACVSENKRADELVGLATSTVPVGQITGGYC